MHLDFKYFFLNVQLVTCRGDTTVHHVLTKTMVENAQRNADVTVLKGLRIILRFLCIINKQKVDRKSMQIYFLQIRLDIFKLEIFLRQRNICVSPFFEL